MKRKKITTGWFEYFNFSARERRGVLVLSCVLLLQIVSIIILRNIPRHFDPPDEKIVQEFLREDEYERNGAPAKLTNEIVSENIQPFNPNEIKDTLKHITGLTTRQQKVISNYISKGGRFKIKSDFKKMYCISDNDFIKLSPFLLLPDSLERKMPEKKKESHKKAIDIGKADSIELLTVRGIGPVLSSRICKYREKLGGFYSIDQLKEVWGINDTVFEKILPHIILEDTIPFRFIYLNTDSFQILASHPYLKGKMAGLICNYRKQHLFKSKEELSRFPFVSGDNFRKIVPYLKLN
jgi:competence ComEA-like helix-hairpin-helix protein